MSPIGALAPFLSARPRAAAPAERCELCGAPISERHPHVVALADRALRCACTACAVLFRDAGAGGGRYRTVSDRVIHDEAFHPGSEAWARLNVPVRLAFFLRGNEQDWTAFYPSPAGPVEAPLEPDAVAELGSLTPLAAEVEPHIEALLVRRERDGSGACLLVPVDACYELVALVRKSWRGFDGGDEARRNIDEFLQGLRARARGRAR